MPIRMTDDEPGESERNEDSGGSGSRSSGGGSSGGGSGGGGGSGLLALLGLLFFFFKHPKLTAVIVVIVGLFWFFSGDSTPAPKSEPQRPGPVARQESEPNRGTGATLDPKVYDETLVHEPLADGQLPERVSLLQYAPRRRSQGKQGSCVGWATSYAARSILRARETGEPPDSVAFSPSFVYNPIARPGCRGTYLKKALEELQAVGDLPFGDFAYTDRSCETKPSAAEKARAAEYRIVGFTRLSVDSSDYRTNTLAVKQHLAQGAPVVIGMNVGGTFEDNGFKVWHPKRNDYDMGEGWGGHAMAVIGYDDTLEGGAFQLMNSWGDDWGQGGVAFVRYKDFDHFVKEAYGLYPMGRVKKDTAQRIRFGLVKAGTQERIALAPVSGTTFRTVRPISKGTRFKVEFSNTRPVYTYLFGQETDGSSYVLFPYTPKHSPYCGTTGTRVFPRKQSLTADELGKRDSVAVVISPRALDFQALNTRINSAPGSTYAEKLLAAVGNVSSVRGRVNSREALVELDATGVEVDRVHALVLEFDKQ